MGNMKCSEIRKKRPQQLGVKIEKNWVLDYTNINTNK